MVFGIRNKCLKLTRFESNLSSIFLVRTRTHTNSKHEQKDLSSQMIDFATAHPIINREGNS